MPAKPFPVEHRTYFLRTGRSLYLIRSWRQRRHPALTGVGVGPTGRETPAQDEAAGRFPGINERQEVYRARVVELVREINESAAVARAESLMTPLGADGARAQNPEARPRKIKKSPAPFFHALRKKVLKALWEAYGLFFAAFWEAAEKLRTGDRDAAFPVGSFPPGLPFVTA